MQVTYEAIFELEEDGQYSVVFPDFEGATCGDGMSDALHMAAEFLWLTVSGYISDGDVLPTATFGNNLKKNQKAIAISLKFDQANAEAEWGWLSTTAAAKALNVTPQRVRVMAYDGVLPSRKIGRDLYVSRTAVEERIRNPRGPGRVKVVKDEAVLAG